VLIITVRMFSIQPPVNAARMISIGSCAWRNALDRNS
jgi:hypothetical protein